MKKLLLIALLIVGVFTGTVFSATFSEPDNGEHPFVGLTYFEAPSGIFRCSGTLLSDSVFLTAGHCTKELGVVNSRTWVTFDEEVVLPEIVFDMTDAEFGDWLDAQRNFVSGQAIPHPLYNDYAEFPYTYDIGLVILDTPVVMDAYGSLPEQGFLDTVRGQQKRDNFEVVGYGLQGYINPFFGAERARYKGDVSLIETISQSNGFGLASAKFTNNPGNGNGVGGSCFGDSGGPVFYGDSNTVVAVVSFGITPCIGVDYQYRTDVPDALDFVLPYLNS